MVTRSEAKALYDGEWQWIDGVETVTYLAPDEAETEDTEAKGKRRGLNRKEIAFGANLGIGPTDQVWTLWTSTLTKAPETGGRITDGDGNAYYVRSVNEVRFGAQWVCYTVRRE